MVVGHDEGCRVRVQIDKRLIVLAQYRGRVQRRDIAGEAIMDSLGFAWVGYGADDCFRLHDLFDRHGYGLGRDILQALKPAFAKLLAAASLIQIHHNVGVFDLKVRRWIIKGQVPVFSDADEGDIHR